MALDSDDELLIKGKRLIRKKNFFEATLNHDARSVVPDIPESLMEPYAYNIIKKNIHDHITAVHSYIALWF